MASSVPLSERVGWWGVMWVMVVHHVVLAVASFALVVTLSVEYARTAANYKSSDFTMLIVLTVFTTLYAVLGVVAFFRPKTFWWRHMAVGSVVVIILFFTAGLTLAYRSLLCGIEQSSKNDLVVKFNESRIEKCRWTASDSTCILSFPDAVMVKCASVRHFWRHIFTSEQAELRGTRVNNIVVGGFIYGTIILVVMLLSLRISMECGVEEATVLPPAAAFYRSSSSSASSSVPLTNII